MEIWQHCTKILGKKHTVSCALKCVRFRSPINTVLNRVISHAYYTYYVVEYRSYFLSTKKPNNRLNHKKKIELNNDSIISRL